MQGDEGGGLGDLGGEFGCEEGELGLGECGDVEGHLFCLLLLFSWLVVLFRLWALLLLFCFVVLCCVVLCLCCERVRSGTQMRRGEGVGLVW